ncbi:MAG: acyl-CoA thioesterase domain-containing protein [Pseudomonadota bacterium]
MPAFTKHENNSWASNPSAMGPFTGLQGGAVAGLLVSELEWKADKMRLGLAVSASVEFLRPTPPGALRSEPAILRKGRRTSVLTNRLYAGERQTAQATACFVAPVATPIAESSARIPNDPSSLAPLPPKPAIHGTPWMMDNFAVRPADDGIIWFKYLDAIVDGMTPLARVLGPADWTHGLGRPNSPKLADPNVNLQVCVSRHPVGDHIGILPKTTWMPTGNGTGEGTLYDTSGPFGRVMMAVALTEFG